MAKTKIKPAPAPTVVITEIQLVEVQTYRDRVADLKAKLKAAEALENQASAQVMFMLQSGAIVQSSSLTACVVQQQGDCRPKWKEHYLGLAARFLGLAPAKAEADLKAVTEIPVKDVLVIAEKVLP